MAAQGESVASYAAAAPPATEELVQHLTRQMSRMGDSGEERLAILKVVGERAGWLIQPTDVTLGEQIGRGATAKVYKSVWHGLEVAVKTIDPELFHKDPGGLTSFCRELEILARQRHPFILPFFAASLNYPQHCWVVTDIMDRTLVQWLHGTRERQWTRVIPLPPLRDRLRVSLEIALGMQHLHEQVPMVIHRDLKPSNVFLDSRQRAYVADFGYARQLQPNEADQTGETGTYMYMAPEVIRYELYNEKCDVYSFGILLNELMTGHPPYLEAYLSPVQVARGVADGKLRPMLVKDGSPLMAELIQACWANDPAVRPAFGQITTRLRAIIANAHDDAAPKPSTFWDWWQSLPPSGTPQYNENVS